MREKQKLSWRETVKRNPGMQREIRKHFLDYIVKNLGIKGKEAQKLAKIAVIAILNPDD